MLITVYKNNDETGLLDYDYPLITNIKGINIGLLGYKGWSTKECVKDKIKEDIDYMKENSDYIIITFHWGDEARNYPNEVQTELAHLG